MNGYFNITTSNQYIVGTVSWYEYDVSTATNKSKVHAELRLSRTNTGYETWSTSGGYTLTINGQQFYGAATRDKVISHNSNTLMVSGDAEITHNSNGSKTITITISGDTSNLDISSQSGTAVLTTIPRASTLKFSEGIIGTSMPITVNRADDSFTHTLTYSFGSLSGTIANNVGDYYSWDVPTSFYGQIPNAKNGTGTITCITYSGGTQVGSNSYSFKVWCNESQCIPSLSATLIDSNEDTVALTGSTSTNPILVDYKSIAKLTLSYQAKNSATISRVLVNGQAQQIGTVYNLTGVAFNSISIQVVDSRGYDNTYTFAPTGTTADKNYDRIQYVELSINPTTSRSSQIADDMLVSVNGNYFKGNFSDAVANTLAITWQVRERNGTWTSGATVISPTISGTENKYDTPTKIELTNPLSSDGKWDYQKIYEFEFTATDKLMSKVGSDTRPKGQYNFAIFQDVVTLANGEPISTYNVGDVYITSTNTNPKNILGYGTWTLFDKEFTNIGRYDIGFEPSGNISSVIAAFTRSGHNITLNLSFITDIAFTDTAVTLGTINFDEWGVTRLGFSTREVGYSDGGNCVFMVDIAGSTGEMSCVDIVGADSMVAGSSCYITIPFQFIYTYMLDSACNKFYWRRTA